MQVIGIVTILLSMILWSSCKGPSIRPQLNADVSIEYDRCRIRCYDIKAVKTVTDDKCNRFYKKNKYPRHIPIFYTLDTNYKKRTDRLIFKAGDYPLSACHKLTGV